eukprot:SAG11_NODE_21583_length_422_cov_1.421053_1_plen_86_part_01
MGEHEHEVARFISAEAARAEQDRAQFMHESFADIASSHFKSATAPVFAANGEHVHQLSAARDECARLVRQQDVARVWEEVDTQCDG